MKSNELKVAIYCRVGNSVDKQEIKIQEKLLKKYCKEKGFENFKIYSDIGYSFNNINRPNYQLMIKDLKNGKVDMIIAYSFDRLFRSIVDFEKAMYLLAHYKCNLRTLKESFNTIDTLEKAIPKLLPLFNEYEKRCLNNE